jgi:hypothetical protein
MKTTEKRFGNLIATYHPEYDYIECGSYRESDWNNFCGLDIVEIGRDSRIELFPDRIDLLLILMNKFSEYKEDSNNPTVEFFKYQDEDKFDTFCVLVFSDYQGLWIKMSEISNQTFYPEHYKEFSIRLEILSTILEESNKFPRRTKTGRNYEN